MPKITSRDNQKIKFARSVKTGREHDFIFIEGIRLAEEIFKSDIEIIEIYCTENFTASERGRDFLKTVKFFEPQIVSESVFDAIADTKNSQGIIVICRKPAYGKSRLEAALGRLSGLTPILLMLHEINNPTNLGAILRTAEAVAVTGVILTKKSTEAFSPKAIRGSMGACLRLPLWTDADFSEVLNWARAKGFKSVCADINGAKIYTQIDANNPLLIVTGSEAHGLTEKERAQIDESVVIPMANGVESLNVAAACGIILYETRRDKFHIFPESFS